MHHLPTPVLPGSGSRGRTLSCPSQLLNGAPPQQTYYITTSKILIMVYKNHTPVPTMPLWGVLNKLRFLKVNNAIIITMRLLALKKEKTRKS